MKKRPVSPPMKRLYVSGETIHILYPGLPLKDLRQQDGLYDSLNAFDLARELGLHLKNVSSTMAESTNKRGRSGVKNYPSVDMFVVDRKEYFSVRITSQRTGYSPDDLIQLTLQPDTGIRFVYRDLDDDQDQVLFFDVESVKTYRPKNE